jgi:hypothetical protein
MRRAFERRSNLSIAFALTRVAPARLERVTRLFAGANHAQVASPEGALARRHSNWVRVSGSLSRWRAGSSEAGAGDETRTRDINLGKVALYQLSYTRAASPEG